uniref:Uncharacterized protein n=1 Tax=Kalanchoe fedtschenkoi TaxID=63787 RepID=A0A7N0TL18_KALFE
MALLFSSTFHNLNRPLLLKLKPTKYPHVRSHSFRDEFPEGKATNKVDANLHVLKQRMEELSVRERSNNRHQQHHAAGWAYKSYNYTISGYKGKGNNSDFRIIMSEFTELLGQMGVTFALVFLSGFLGICLASLLIRSCSTLLQHL